MSSAVLPRYVTDFVRTREPSATLVEQEVEVLEAVAVVEAVVVGDEM